MSVQRAIEEWHAMQAGWRRTTTAVEMRLDWDAFLPNTDVSDEPVTIAGIPARWVGAGDRTLLYLHGGAYRIGSSQSHKGLAARIAAAAKCSVLLPDYRLAPEHRYPAAIDDAVTVYRWLLDEGHSNIAIAGDSAGGGLSVATMLALRGSLPLPSAAVLLSPWTDFTVSGASYRTHQDQDPINRRVAVVALAADYLGDADARAASPLFADLRGLPPTLVQAGGREIVLDDSRAFVDAAVAAGVDARLELYEPMIHVWQLFPYLDDTTRAVASIAAFLDAHWA